MHRKKIHDINELRSIAIYIYINYYKANYIIVYMIGQMHTRETQHTIFEFLLVCFSNNKI
jgi:hypothetical protein